jgi:hypothetical protein
MRAGRDTRGGLNVGQVNRHVALKKGDAPTRLKSKHRCSVARRPIDPAVL